MTGYNYVPFIYIILDTGVISFEGKKLVSCIMFESEIR